MEEISQKQGDLEQKSGRWRGGGKLLLAVILFIALLIVLFFSFKSLMEDERKENSNNSINQIYPNDSNTAGNQDSNLTQINGDQASGVEVTAVYEKEKSQNQIFFKLYFNTHAADYSDYNFQQNIVIKDSQGKLYSALNIAKEGSGHHQSIEMAFPSASSPFKLVVKKLADVPERIFDW